MEPQDGVGALMSRRGNTGREGSRLPPKRALREPNALALRLQPQDCARERSGVRPSPILCKSSGAEAVTTGRGKRWPESRMGQPSTVSAGSPQRPGQPQGTSWASFCQGRQGSPHCRAQAISTLQTTPAGSGGNSGALQPQPELLPPPGTSQAAHDRCQG